VNIYATQTFFFFFELIQISDLPLKLYWFQLYRLFCRVGSDF